MIFIKLNFQKIKRLYEEKNNEQTISTPSDNLNDYSFCGDVIVLLHKIIQEQ